MNWDGNPSIVLDIKTRLGVSLPVQVIFSSLDLLLKNKIMKYQQPLGLIFIP